MEFTVDHFTVFRDAKLSIEQASTQLFKARDNRLMKPCLCAIQAVNKGDTIHEPDVNARLEWIRNLNFEGYLVISYHKVTPNAVFVFLDVPNDVKPFIELFQSGYMLSLVDAVRIGSLILDSYDIFHRLNKPHQDVEFDQLVCLRSPSPRNDMRFYLIPPLPWATGIRALNPMTINFKPPESLDLLNIDPNDMVSLHKKFVWKFGLIMYFLMNRKLPFSYADANPGKKDIEKDGVARFSHHIKTTSVSQWVSGKSVLTDLLERCLKPALPQRIDFATLYTSFLQVRRSYIPEISHVSELGRTAEFGRQSALMPELPETRSKSHTMNAGLYTLVQNAAPKQMNSHLPNNPNPVAASGLGPKLTISRNPFEVN